MKYEKAADINLIHKMHQKRCSLSLITLSDHCYVQVSPTVYLVISRMFSLKCSHHVFLSHFPLRIQKQILYNQLHGHWNMLLKWQYNSQKNNNYNGFCINRFKQIGTKLLLITKKKIPGFSASLKKLLSLKETHFFQDKEGTLFFSNNFLNSWEADYSFIAGMF